MQGAEKRETGRAHSGSGSARSDTEDEEPRVFIPVRIGRNTLQALIDPGSVCSYVNRRVAALSIKQGWKREKNDSVALIADGTETPLGECLSGRMLVMNKWVRMKTTIMHQMSYDVLLGMDVLAPL